jgi:hypothetical protein
MTALNLAKATINTPTGPKMPKRRHIAKVSAQMVSTTMPVQNGPP